MVREKAENGEHRLVQGAFTNDFAVNFDQHTRFHGGTGSSYALILLPIISIRVTSRIERRWQGPCRGLSRSRDKGRTRRLLDLALIVDIHRHESRTAPRLFLGFLPVQPLLLPHHSPHSPPLP